MKKYLVSIVLITGYYTTANEEGSELTDYEQPNLRTVRFEVEANSEHDAISKAKDMDNSKLSVWETYAQEI